MATALIGSLAVIVVAALVLGVLRLAGYDRRPGSREGGPRRS